MSLRFSTAQDQLGATFGTTVVDLSGLEGRVYFLDPKTQRLPNLSRKRPVGAVYTTTLNIWPQRFTDDSRTSQIFTIALALAIRAPGEPWRLFNTSGFKSPSDPSERRLGKISEIRRQTIDR
jgi:hypothetical protein